MKYEDTIIWRIIDKLKDIIHKLRKKEPLWSDAKPCGKRFCRYCGGKTKRL